MKIIHTHPVWESGEERLRRLAELKRTCRAAVEEARAAARETA